MALDTVGRNTCKRFTFTKAEMTYNLAIILSLLVFKIPEKMG